jgi:hypothetical protein
MNGQPNHSPLRTWLYGRRDYGSGIEQAICGHQRRSARPARRGRADRKALRIGSRRHIPFEHFRDHGGAQADCMIAGYLPPGQYHFAITTAAAVYCSVAGLPIVSKAGAEREDRGCRQQGQRSGAAAAASGRRFDRAHFMLDYVSTGWVTPVPGRLRQYRVGPDQ